jgi:hypothetical protein
MRAGPLSGQQVRSAPGTKALTRRIEFRLLRCCGQQLLELGFVSTRIRQGEQWKASLRYWLVQLRLERTPTARFQRMGGLAWVWLEHDR